MRVTTGWAKLIEELHAPDVVRNEKAHVGWKLVDVLPGMNGCRGRVLRGANNNNRLPAQVAVRCCHPR